MLGGTFSNPADKFSFLDVPLLRRYPYAMPGIVAATFTFFGVALAYFLMEEVCGFSPLLPTARFTHKGVSTQTLPPKGNETLKQPEEVISYGSMSAPPATTPLSAWQLLTIPSLRSLIISGFALAFVSTAFETVFVLFAYTPIKAGGLGFNVCV